MNAAATDAVIALDVIDVGVVGEKQPRPRALIAG